MNKTIVPQWRPVYAAYIILLASVILLFFTNRWDAAFSEGVKDSGFFDFIPGLTLHNLVLFVVDICLMCMVFTKMQNEDERVEKIRNYVTKVMFMLGVLTVIIIGLFLNTVISLLACAAFFQVYYIAVFRLCLYRDPEFMYMSDEQLKAYNNKPPMRKYNIYMYLLIGVITAICNTLCTHYQRFDLLWIVIIVNAYVIGFLRTVYLCWKG